MKIGIFDSGLGGLTVAARLRARLPHADLIYFADQANVPYGDRDPLELHALLKRNLQLLVDGGAEMIVMGCNTSCAIGAELGWPEIDVPVFDLIEAGANMVFTACHLHAGVVATNATVRSRAYTNAMKRRQDMIEVEEVGAPELVPLIERGASSEEYGVAVDRVLARFTKPLSTIVLGCSHFPILRDYFVSRVGPVAIIDPAEAQADAVCAAVRHLGREAEGSGTAIAWTNADPAHFAAGIERLPLAIDGLTVAALPVARANAFS